MVAGDAELIKDQGIVNGSQKVEPCNGRAKIKVKRNGSNYVFAVKSKDIKTAIIRGGKE